jgi:hypothetical protein
MHEPTCNVWTSLTAFSRKTAEQRARIDAAVKDNLLFSSFKGVQFVDGKWRTAAGEDRAEALEKLYQCMEEKVFGCGGDAKDIITQVGFGRIVASEIGTDSLRESVTRCWMLCGAKQQCDRTLHAGRRGRLLLRHRQRSVRGAYRRRRNDWDVRQG